MANDVLAITPEERKAFKYGMIAQIDRSQGHLERASDCLNVKTAPGINAGPGNQQPHYRHTFAPLPRKADGTQFQHWSECRQPLCSISPPCVICQGAVAKFGHRPDFQSIGQKGSKKILYERGKLRAGMKAPEQKEVLNQEPDWGSTKSAIQELFEREGHCALIGVACHPEFASKEHGWRRLKQLTKWGVNGTMSKLKELVAEGRLKLGLKARLEDARQSRECMEA